MILDRLSIQWRITWLVGFCLLTIVVGLVGLSLQRMSDNSAQIRESNARMLEAEAHQRLLAEGRMQGLTFQHYLLAAYQEGLGFTRQALQLRHLAHQQRWQPQQLRSALNEQVKEGLQANSQLLSLYLIFEPDALDGVDADFAGQSILGSNENGRFAAYWAQRDGQSSSMAVSEALISDRTPGPDGSPFSTWFDCPKSTAKPCLLSPYFDDASGQRSLITTLSFPLLEDGKVIGVAGMDISLQNLQRLVLDGNRNLYDGAGDISILSPSGLLAGHSADPGFLGQRLDDGGQSQQWLRQGKAQVEARDGHLRVLSPLRPIPDAEPWGVLLSIPMATVLQPVLALQRDLDAQNTQDTQLELLFGLLAALAGLLLVWLTARGVTRPILGVVATLKDIASGGGDLTGRLTYARKDELGELSIWFNRFLDRLQPLIADLQRLVRDAHGSADHSAVIAERISTAMQQQYREIDQVATASHQMSATAQDVARSAAQAADATQGADQAAREGLAVIDHTSRTIDGLARAIADAMTQVEGLAASSERIGSVLEVIRSIAEQTNLLALNAAIEAARAGDAGRGFAVVADEVRNLARSTRDSIEEIRQVIERLQDSTREVVDAMQSGTTQAREGVQQVGQAAASLTRIGAAVAVIGDMNLQIASAAEQQSTVAAEISHNVAVIRDVTESLSAQAKEAQQVSQSLNHQASQQQQLTEQFRV
ncbi:MAG: methyl-accepting chemotaxis protein [Pseudomonas sp.]|nr:methyl-accepting chemotaxis protein [Pseudomonas sp.]MDX1369292.1 methyl-accepting chemotaxis protein [Pseudomonas sp.]